MPSRGDVHELSSEDFLDEVHSFEFWFHSVEGYLSGLEFGHTEGAVEEAMAEADRERLISVLCNYCVGETAALEGASGLIAIAPNRRSKIFLATQVVDEGRHLEVLLHRMQELGVADPEAEIARRASASLIAFKDRLLELVATRNWEAAILAQNVILEALEFAVFRRHAETADAVTREVLQGIVKDERRHIGFGENELGRRLKATPAIADRLRRVKSDLDHLVLHALEETSRSLGIDAAERETLGRMYFESVRRLGLDR
jgi:1,2-phenylacetyl-CoA epoxidase catalytic subunit